MCGRYAITSPLEAIIEAFAVKGARPNLQPRYNAAPSQDLPVVRAGREGRELILMRWGLVPSWSKGPDSRYSMINARAETVASKPAYRGPFRQRRCLVPANGFYEWKKTAEGKQPYFGAAQLNFLDWLFDPDRDQSKIEWSFNCDTSPDYDFSKNVRLE